MNRNYYIQLTSNLYRLTLLFPKKEPLRYKMRELADEILADLIYQKNPSNLKQHLEILDSFFEIAKSQNWVSPKDVLKVQQEYSKLKEGFEKPEELKSQENYRDRVSANERQQRILKILKEKGKAQVGEFKKIFPEVTKRTLRRDFEQLLNQGKIERLGEKNNTFYQLEFR